MVILGQGLGTIQILADALPKIVPYVLINHREVCFLAIFFNISFISGVFLSNILFVMYWCY